MCVVTSTSLHCIVRATTTRSTLRPSFLETSFRVIRTFSPWPESRPRVPRPSVALTLSFSSISLKCHRAPQMSLGTRYGTRPTCAGPSRDSGISLVVLRAYIGGQLQIKMPLATDAVVASPPNCRSTPSGELLRRPRIFRFLSIDQG